MIGAIRDMLEQMVVAAGNGVVAVAHVSFFVVYATVQLCALLSPVLIVLACLHVLGVL